jgi:plastocyanin
MKALLTIIILALLAWGAYALFGPEGQVAAPIGTTDNGTQTYLTPAQTATSTATSSPTVIPETKSFTVSGKNFSFTPATMQVNRGDRVRITFNNTSGTHDLVVEGYNARTKILQTGQSETIEFVANQSGSFEYYCSVGQHRSMGMKGTLTVN